MWAEAPVLRALPQAPRSSWCPPGTARLMPSRMCLWPARQRPTQQTSPTAGSGAVPMSSMLGGALGGGAGWALGGRLWGACWLNKACASPHTRCITATCRPGCGSWWMGACGSGPPSLTMLVATPVCPATASCTHPRPLPTSLCSVSLTPAASPSCSPRLGQAILPHSPPLLSPRPSPGDHDAS